MTTWLRLLENSKCNHYFAHATMASLRAALLGWVKEVGSDAFDRLGHYGPAAAGLHPTRAANGAAMLDMNQLLERLLEAEPSAQIDDVPLRNALSWVVTQIPSLSLGGRDMDRFADETSACIRCLLNHVRRLKQNPKELQQASCVY